MSTPMHVELAEKLRERIRAGEFTLKPEDDAGRDKSTEDSADEASRDRQRGKLPSEAELMRHYRMSRTTVRAALKELQDQGLLQSASGRGYFVRTFTHFTYRPQDDFKRGSTIRNADSFTAAVVAERRTADQQIDVRVAAAEDDVARRMQVEVGTPVVIRRRLRFIDGVPVQINDSHYPLDIVVGTEIMNPASIDRGVNEVLAENGHAQVRALDEIWLRMPTPDEVRQLQLGRGTPVAEHIVTGFTADERVVRMARVIVPGDRNVITFERTHPDYESGSTGE